MKFLIEQLDTKRNTAKRLAEVESLQDAIAVVKYMVDQYLVRYRKDHASADSLYTQYRDCGVIPRISYGQGFTCYFDHLHYASSQCLKAFGQTEAPLPSRSLDFTRVS